MNTPLSTRSRLRQSQFSRAVQYRPSRLELWMNIAAGTIRHPFAVARVLWAVWRWEWRWERSWLPEAVGFLAILAAAALYAWLWLEAAV